MSLPRVAHIFVGRGALATTRYGSSRSKNGCKPYDRAPYMKPDFWRVPSNRFWNTPSHTQAAKDYFESIYPT